MTWFPTYRSKLVTSFVALGLFAIALADWQATTAAAEALEQSNYERLTAIRETKRRTIERYFGDIFNHVLALSSDQSILEAFADLRNAWKTLPANEPGSDQYEQLRRFYADTFAPLIAKEISQAELMTDWFPRDAQTRALQFSFLPANPNPLGSKDLLLEPKGLGLYGRVHARFHPTLHRYQSAFGFYDIFLIDGDDGRILYSVFKEVDLGATLTEEPYRRTTLAKAFERAKSVPAVEMAVIEDYAPYLPSHFGPAAFVAAPIWRAGSRIGVLAIQVSLAEVNQVMTSNQGWEGEGLGRTGQSYILGPDRKLRSDARLEIESSKAYLAQLKDAGVPAGDLARIAANRTAVLTLSLQEDEVFSGKPGIQIGRDFRGAEVLRSHAPLEIPGLSWVLVAEMETEEAFAPIKALRRRSLGTGLVVAGLFFLAARKLGKSVTEPVRALADGAQRLARRDFSVRLPVTSQDELGQLAESFNHMVDDLQRTTVSRDELDRANQELQRLNARLIQAQEDERSRLARELHDDMSQRLAALAIQIGSLRNSAATSGEQRVQDLEAVQRGVSQLANDIHGLSRRLHSSVLNDLGLVAAIESECRGFFERGGAPVDFVWNGPVESIPLDHQLALYRIVQEGLRNIQRHAEASEVTLRLSVSAVGITLEIHDNGRGFDRQSKDWHPGLGLASMEERMRLLGGTLTVRSSAGQGTSINAHLNRA